MFILALYPVCIFCYNDLTIKYNWEKIFCVLLGMFFHIPAGVDAMKGELYIKEKRCKGCGICAAFCPKQVLEVSLLGKIVPVRPEDCIACGQCEMRCPDFAIFVERRESK